MEKAFAGALLNTTCGPSKEVSPPSKRFIKKQEQIVLLQKLQLKTTNVAAKTVPSLNRTQWNENGY